MVATLIALMIVRAWSIHVVNHLMITTTYPGTDELSTATTVYPQIDELSTATTIYPETDELSK